MLEVALIDGINDSDKEAQLLARFAQSIMVCSFTTVTILQESPHSHLDLLFSAG